jgi:hypothetical protein
MAGQIVGGALGIATAASVVDGSGVSAAAATVLLVVSGSLAGRRIGRWAYERDLATRTLAYRAAVRDQSSTFQWQNPDTGSVGRVKRMGQTYAQYGNTCAAFTEQYAPEGASLGLQQQTVCLNERGFVAGRDPFRAG